MASEPWHDAFAREFRIRNVVPQQFRELVRSHTALSKQNMALKQQRTRLGAPSATINCMPSLATANRLPPPPRRFENITPFPLESSAEKQLLILQREQLDGMAMQLVAQLEAEARALRADCADREALAAQVIF